MTARRSSPVACVALLATQGIALVGANPSPESRPYYYLVRLLAFLLIVAATVRKNRRPDSGSRPPASPTLDSKL